MHVHALQDGGQVVGDAPAAHDEHILHLGGVPSQQLEELAHADGLADEVELVPRLGRVPPVGDDDLIAPLRGAEEDGQLLDPVIQLRQGVAADEVVLLHPKADKLHPAPVEGLDIGRRGEAQQPGDLHRRGVLGVDDHVDAQFLFEDGELHRVLHVAHPGDGVLGAQPLGGEAADHVYLVQAGGGDDDVGGVDAGLPQCHNRRAVALDAQDVQGLRRAAQGVVVGVDDGDVVLLPGEMLRQSEAHLAVAHDNDFQVYPSLISMVKVLTLILQHAALS